MNDPTWLKGRATHLSHLKTPKIKPPIIDNFYIQWEGLGGLNSAENSEEFDHKNDTLWESKIKPPLSIQNFRPPFDF